MNSTKKLVFTSLMAAAAIVLMVVASFVPTMSVSLAVIAGLFVAAAFLECGRTHAFLCYLTASILGLLLVPDRSVALMFVLLFGSYPIFKSVAESAREVWVEYLLKFAFCNAMLVLLYFLLKSFATLPKLPEVKFVYPLTLLVLNIVFFIYDLGFSKLVSLYRYYRARGRK
ncbi:MAG: hypothetical protein E7452_02655 [Ruminococcaceae bacterium]|nr:hypothetical protein [Oscillospiraceae bacterium]